MFLSENFRTLLNILFTPQCVLCENTLDIVPLCKSCQSLAPIYPLHNFASTTAFGALFYYELSMRELIKGAKFYGKRDYIYALKTLVEDRLGDAQVLNALKEIAPSVICPLPTPPLKRFIRGIDIPLMFAHLLKRRLGAPVKNLLGAHYHKPSLAKISAKSVRKKSIVGAFYLKKPEVSYQRILLVDDIFTTGSTFDESSKLLKSIAGEVRCLAISRTP